MNVRYSCVQLDAQDSYACAAIALNTLQSRPHFIKEKNWAAILILISEFHRFPSDHLDRRCDHRSSLAVALSPVTLRSKCTLVHACQLTINTTQTHIATPNRNGLVSNQINHLNRINRINNNNDNNDNNNLAPVLNPYASIAMPSSLPTVSPPSRGGKVSPPFALDAPCPTTRLHGCATLVAQCWPR